MEGFRPRARRHPEEQYLDLLEQILETGEKKIDRTGVGTLSLFGTMMRFDLSDDVVPIFTTKRIFWKTAVKEMLWFLTGGTNIRELLQNNVKIWTDWPLAKYRRETGHDVSQEEFESLVLADEEFAAQWGELGPVYGKQWRRWLGPDGREHDQVATLIEMIKKNPSSRRLLFHGWNVAEVDQMALPPCHLLYQFHVSNSGRLSCLLFQRSADLFLGQNWNLVHAAVLVRMIAQQCDLTPGEVIWMGGDTHLYLNHVDQAREQLSRSPRPLPRMKLVRKPDSIDGYRIEDFVVDGYDPHPAIKADVAV